MINQLWKQLGRLVNFFVITAIYCLIAPNTVAQPVLQIGKTNTKYILAPYIEIAEDKAGKFTIDQISDSRFSGQFRVDPTGKLNFGFTSSVYWVRIRLKFAAIDKRTWLLKINNSALEHVTFFIPDSRSGGFKEQKIGLKFPFQSREIKQRFPTFVLPRDSTYVTTYYLRIYSQSPVDFPMYAETSQQFFQEDHLEQFLFGLYYGIIVVMVLYNLFLYFSIRDRNYLYYVLYSASFGLLQFSLNGLGFEYVWDTPSWIAERCIPVFISATVIWGSVFCANFLELSKTLPWFYRGIKLLIGLAALLLALTLLDNLSVSLMFGTSLGLLFVLTILAASLLCLRVNFRQAIYLLIAWSWFLLGAILASLNGLGFLPSNFFTTYSIQIGSALDVTLLSLALADRINTIKRQKRDLEQEKQQAIQSKKVKEDFLATMSHEIRTPMNAIVGFSRLLEQSRLQEPQSGYARHIRESSENLLVLINDILDFSKIDSGKLSFEEIEIRLEELCTTLLETLRFKINEKNLRVYYEIDEALPDVFLGDPVRLNQILLNLLSNAVKFTHQGEVKLNARLLSAQDEEIIILFEVQDTGIGIPDDKLSIIFESFSQATPQTTRMYGGTGLGLSIVKQLVELQGGQVWVKSSLGEGSLFSVTLPFRKASTTRHHIQVHPQDIREGFHILLLDDNPINQLVAIHTIQKWKAGIQIDVADNGREGIEMLHHHMYDLLLIDMQMPEMDGCETARYIRHELPYPVNVVPIIALTASLQEEDYKKAMVAGMDDYLSKPFEAQELFRKVNKIHENLLKSKANTNKFDIKHVEKASLGDREFLIQLMEMFLKKVPETITSMQADAVEDNWQQVATQSHKVQSIFVSMGLLRLVEDLKKIEQFSLDNSLRQNGLIRQLIQQLKQDCEIIYKQIEKEKENLINNYNET